MILIEKSNVFVICLLIRYVTRGLDLKFNKYQKILMSY